MEEETVTEVINEEETEEPEEINEDFIVKFVSQEGFVACTEFDGYSWSISLDNKEEQEEELTYLNGLYSKYHNEAEASTDSYESIWNRVFSECGIMYDQV